MSINNINTVQRDQYCCQRCICKKKAKEIHQSSRDIRILSILSYDRSLSRLKRVGENVHAFERFQWLVEWNSYHRSEEKSPVSLTPLSGSLSIKNRLVTYQWRSNSCLRSDWMMRENWEKKSRNGEREKEDLPKPRAHVSKWCLSLFSPSNGCIISRRLFFLCNMQGAIDRLSEWPVVTPIALRISLWDPCDNDKWINLRCNTDNFAITRKLIESPRSTLRNIECYESETHRIVKSNSVRFLVAID